MLFIAEVALTIWAWNRGWRWYGLIPLAVPVCIGIVLGVILFLSGKSIDDLPPALSLIDILAVIVLIYMVAKPKVSVSQKTENDNTTGTSPV